MARKPRQPRCFIIAGPNGAGKTTFARRYLPHYADCDVFVNADLIAAGLSPFAPEVAAVKAGRLVLEQIEWFAELRRDIAFETTLSGRTYLKLLERLRADDYRVTMYFLWLKSAETAISRVAKRVEAGGHHVPAEDIRRRYDRGVRNLFEVYRPHLGHFKKQLRRSTKRAGGRASRFQSGATARWFGSFPRKRLRRRVFE